MRKIWKNKTFWLTAAALLLVGGMSIKETMAYFTTYVEAQGGYTVSLGPYTEIGETVNNMTKQITISNTGSVDCYVRVKVFSGSLVEITYSGSSSWSKGADDYWYYKDIVPVGGNTGVLQATISPLEGFEENFSSFNVVVIQECTPVLYKSDGSPYGDWNAAVDTRTDIGTVN